MNNLNKRVKYKESCDGKRFSTTSRKGMVKRLLLIQQKVLCSIAMLFLCLTLHAQRNEIFSEQIRSLRVLVDNNWTLSPIVTLGARQHIEISFDDLTHEYHRYVYRVEHCDALWQPSTDLLQSDYLSGINEDTPIEGYKQSLNTTQLYTHYSLRIPNENMGLLLSGNYRVTVLLEDENNKITPVLTAHFSVVEQCVSIRASVSTNTDRDWNDHLQQLEMALSYGSLAVRDARQEMKTIVLQNNRWDIAVINAPASYITTSGLQWTHNKALIFDAGNEYRKFELLSLHYAGMGIDHLKWFPPYYHATLLLDKPRCNYVYDEEQNGNYFIRTSDNSENDTQSDYVYVHFSLQAEARLDGDFYLNGEWTRDLFLPEYKMHYNADKKVYEASILMKQGYYNYQYLFVPSSDPTRGFTKQAEGNFYQTENKYSIFIYYRPTGSRYDRLVGYRTIEFNPNRP
ncbi:MAG: DUF5103 domain-containing protein [Bacteroidaceae bacterium]